MGFEPLALSKRARFLKNFLIRGLKSELSANRLYGLVKTTYGKAWRRSIFLQDVRILKHYIEEWEKNPIIEFSNEIVDLTEKALPDPELNTRYRSVVEVRIFDYGVGEEYSRYIAIDHNYLLTGVDYFDEAYSILQNAFENQRASGTLTQNFEIREMRLCQAYGNPYLR